MLREENKTIPEVRHPQQLLEELYDRANLTEDERASYRLEMFASLLRIGMECVEGEGS